MQTFSLNWRFTAILSVIFAATILISWFIFSQTLRSHTEEDIRQRALSIMDLLSSVRNYTTNNIYPLLADSLYTETEFIPESVPAFSAKTVFSHFTDMDLYGNFLYREAALNPTNPEDLATEFEEGLFDVFRSNPDQSELTGFANLNGQEVFYNARALTLTSESCLRCHSTPEEAPISLINTYGSEGGFGWELGEIVAIRMLYVPAGTVFEEQNRLLGLVMGIFTLLFVAVIIATNLSLRQIVIKPVNQIARLAQLIYTNKLSLDAPELNTIKTVARRNDEFGDTAKLLEQMTTEVYNRENRMIRESEERYRRTVNSMSEGLVVYSGEGAVQLCNPAAQEIMGLRKEQFMGEMPIDPNWYAIHEDGSPFPLDTHPVFNTLKTGEPQTNIIMGIHKPDARMTWILINTQPLRDQQDNSLYAVVLTFADITERKNAEHTLQSALKQEQELGELKSRFVSIASHEFRTPLAGILATTETLLKFRDRMDEGQVNSRLDRIREKVVHMEDIMNDVLQLARIQAGRVEYKPVPGNLDTVCREIIEEFEFRTQSSERIKHNLDHTVVPAIFDKHLMRRIVTNLVSNALKYSGDQPISITLTKLDSQIMLQVSDQGIGIPEEDLKHIFEPFHRASNIGTIPGTGLGMSIVKQAVELHGGSITVESQVGNGATFTVTIPAQSKPTTTQEIMQVKQ